ncbi:CHASE2 domain-containing protein [Gorillibacterium sp. sgz5001074]|uniref:CHASE2 domain-containing protein n=1 Tax=Gorillibacterium sp. sgz5001074 TaxID=3446695 RepID=UPI003F664CAC
MKKKQLLTGIWGNLAVVILVLFFFGFNTFDVLSRALYDFNMSKSADSDYRHDIVVVGIDDQSLQEIGAWPWDRKVYVPLLQNLEKQGAKVIAFDVMFNAKGNADSDKAFADELAKHKNVILPSQAVFDGNYNAVNNDNITKRSKDKLIQSKSLITPIPELGQKAQTALINANLDDDSVIRKTWLQVETPQGVLPSLALKTAELAGANVQEILSRFPGQEMNIRYNLYSSNIQMLPFTEVLKGSVKLKDRIVLIGFTASGFENDDGTTPIEKRTKLVYAHANIIHQLLNGGKVEFENRTVTRIWMLAMVALMAAIAWRLKPILGMLLVAVSAAVILAGQYWMFSSMEKDVNAAYPLIAMLFSYLVNIAIKTFYETKQRHYITKQFGRYISPDLVKEIAATDQEIQLGGISKELTILFLDVRGFTPLSEKLSPEEVVGFLNMMFNLITEKTLENHGTIDKFIGDAAMILFNAPLDVKHHEYYAVKTAYEIQKGMEKVRQDIMDRYQVTIAVGIGINTGPVVVGNIGSYLRVDYTAIGDNVNTAARIESNTQPNQVLVSEATYERTKDYFEYQFVGEKMMKGKSVGIKLYEVLGHIKAPK